MLTLRRTIVLTLLLLIIPITSSLAASMSQSFRISVVIPAIAGLNAPAEPLTAEAPALETHTANLIVIEKVTRGAETILLKTIALR